MATRPLRCRLGFHDYVRRPAGDERPGGPGRQVCRVCGRERELTLDGIPPGFVGG
ncbi:hypothetical protein ACI782_13840 [Geodermatophilus sp. SYSU D00703]